MSQTILEVDKLSVAFYGNEVVRDVSFHVERGETLALVGESGSGKSATALSIMQLLPYRYASHPQGSIKVDGLEMVGASKQTLLDVRGDRVGMVFQEPMTSLNPLQTIEKQIGEVLFVHRAMGKRQAAERIEELLDLVGLKRPDRLSAYPHEMSGGQRQRVMIAMALANEPDLLIADEPTTALDVTVQARVLDLLNELRHRLNMALLLITHDLGVVRKMADRVCVMTNGEIVEQNDTQAIFNAPQHNYTKRLIAAEPSGLPVPYALDAPEVIRADSVSVYYDMNRGWFSKNKEFQAVKEVSTIIRRGQTLGIVGESGSGKTTLAMAFLRLKSSRGEIYLGDTAIQGLTAKQMRPMRRVIQVVFQDPYGSLSPRLSVLEIIAAGLKVHHPELSGRERRDKVAQALVEVGLEPTVMDRYPHEFSGGQRQRIAIARAIIVDPEVIVLDEPTSALDLSVQARIVDLLRDLQVRKNLAYLFISHDLKVVRALSHDVIVMKDGEIVEQGSAKEVLDAPQQDYTKALMAAAFELEAS